MKRKSIWVMVFVRVFLSVLVARVMPGQDKYSVKVPGGLVNVDFMVKDSKRFADSGRWGYAVFDYDARPIHSRQAP